jgi:signal transduction histidine kinase
VQEWSRHAGVEATFRAEPAALERMAPEIETGIYRIAQEALNNVAKHARARSATVLLDVRGDDLVLVVEDDGVGLKPGSADETMLGLSGMRERAFALGGTLTLAGAPGGGTRVVASIPITAARPRGSRAAVHDGGAPDLTPRNAHADAGDVGDEALSAIQTRLQELQRAIAARDEFIATVAHELRNPVSPLMFQVRLAMNRVEQLVAGGEPVGADWIQMQLRGVEQRLYRLLETLDRLLDVSRLSTGRIDLVAEPMHLIDAVRDVIAGFEGELAVARCKLTLDARSQAAGTWDRLRVEQIIRNLLSNAIRFGAGGPIEVVVDADDDFASIAVRDHGVGIAAEQQSKIFERFERGLQPRSGGFGIGLWIVRNICRAMGGAVTVESTPGQGACFTVLLPRRHARQAIEATSE